jgi:ABC-type multidrug transport system permease subunit
LSFSEDIFVDRLFALAILFALVIYSFKIVIYRNFDLKRHQKLLYIVGVACVITHTVFIGGRE